MMKVKVIQKVKVCWGHCTNNVIFERKSYDESESYLESESVWQEKYENPGLKPAFHQQSKMKIES